MVKLYIASPFFNEKELGYIEQVENVLGKKHLVFSPRHNNSKETFGTQLWKTETYNTDINHILWADVVVAILSGGNYDDTGTAFEVGYAKAIVKPIVVFNPENKTLNLMVGEGLHAHITDLKELENYDFDTLPLISYRGEVI